MIRRRLIIIVKAMLHRLGIQPTWVATPLGWVTRGRLFPHYYWQWRARSIADIPAKQCWTEWGKIYLSQFQSEGPVSHLLFEEIEIAQAQSVLEIGCGFGRNLKPAREKLGVPLVAGIDFSETMLRSAKKYLAGDSVRLCQASAADLPFADRSFDVVFTVGCLQHVPPESIGKATAEIKRIARKRIITLEASLEGASSGQAITGRWFKNTFVSYDYAREFGIRVLRDEYIPPGSRDVKLTVLALDKEGARPDQVPLGQTSTND